MNADSLEMNEDKKKNLPVNSHADALKTEIPSSPSVIQEEQPATSLSLKKDALFIKLREGKTIHFTRPFVMGIMNVTPDSFSDGGLFFKNHAFFKKVEEMIRFGVDILDIGGESSRPGASPVPLLEEQKRVIPKIKKLKKKYPEICASIDTTKAKIAEEAITYGVDIINDISSGDDSNNAMLHLAADTQTPIVIMHKKGEPRTMQKNIHYDNVVEEVFNYLAEKIRILDNLGLEDNKIIIDPGIGFGKDKEHNIALIRGLDTFKKLGKPILIGASMKSLVSHITGCSLEERLPGTLGLHLASLMRGANIIRVHDVRAAFQSIDTFFPILGG